jgi:plasmid stabilization system protein ParE
MRPIVRLTSAAEEDLLEARGWYRDQVPGLDLRFRDAVREALGRIAERPALYAKVYRDIRRALVHRFPYSIFYRIAGESVLVIAVVHQARDSRFWKRRA